MTLLPRLAGVVCALGVTIAVVGARGAQEIERATTPRLVREFKPHYPQAAKDAKIQGSVTVSAVVLEDGSVGEVTVTRSLDTKYGLDEEAVKCARKWLFKPGTKDGKPVAVLVEIEIAFELR
jgi:protein TonB